ncbi:7-cyano-7-deazaguanine reductase [Oxalobacteraceae bacterium GrIS 2.11]
MSNSPLQSALGKTSTYVTNYDAGLLFPIPRAAKRAEIGINADLPFFGLDIWNAYEVSWLNMRGKPQIAVATFLVPADSPNIIESKSFKLYLNSFNQTRLADSDALLALLRQDISAGFATTVQVKLTLPDEFSKLGMAELEGLSLDRLDIEVNSYTPDATLLSSAADGVPVEETLVSNLLKSNCLVTGQPDWASVQIHYVGPPINQEGLLKYLIGFRNHNEFHEQCVERIFVDILQHCSPQKLTVYARYTRRGGLDINPWRSNFSSKQFPSNLRNVRQ